MPRPSFDILFSATGNKHDTFGISARGQKSTRDLGNLFERMGGDLRWDARGHLEAEA